MTKLFILLTFAASLVFNCEDKKRKEITKEKSDTEILNASLPHDSILEKYQTPPVIEEGKLPPKKNDSI